MKDYAVELNAMAERQKAISFALLAIWGNNDYSPADLAPFTQSKQVPAVLSKEEEMVKYQNKTIKKRLDGRWWVRYYKNGKQVCIYGKTQAECYNKLKKALNSKGKADTPTKQITLGEWLQKWLELYKIPKLQETTVEKIRYTIKNMQPLVGITLNKLDSLTIQNFLNGVDGNRKRELIYTNLKDALTKAVKNKLIADNPFDAVEIKKEKRAEKRALTVDEERRLVQACGQCKEGILFLVCLYQGLRIGEALALTYEDIDFANKTIKINKSLTEKNKIKSTKNGEERTIPLFGRTAAILKNGASGRVCIYSRPVYQRKIDELCKELNIDGISTHSLRHTFATRCAEAGVTAKTVQQWLGHKTLEMTLNVYTHINKDFEQKEVAKFDTHFDTCFQ